MSAATTAVEEPLDRVEPLLPDAKVPLQGDEKPSRFHKQLSPQCRIPVFLQVLPQAHAIGVLRQLLSEFGLLGRRDASPREKLFA